MVIRKGLLFSVLATLAVPSIASASTAPYSDPVAELQFSFPETSLVANGVANETITANVVDANGKLLSLYEGKFSIKGTKGGTDPNGAPYVQTAEGALLEGGSVSGNTETFDLHNGTANIKVIAPPAAASYNYDVLSTEFTDLAGAVHQNNLTIPYTGQRATSIRLTPQTPYVWDDSETKLTLEVLDQTGQLMQLPGKYHLSIKTGTTVTEADFTGPTYTVNVTSPGTAGSFDVSANLSVTGDNGATVGSASATLYVNKPPVGKSKICDKHLFTETLTSANNTIPANDLMYDPTHDVLRSVNK